MHTLNKPNQMTKITTFLAIAAFGKHVIDQILQQLSCNFTKTVFTVVENFVQLHNSVEICFFYKQQKIREVTVFK